MKYLWGGALFLILTQAGSFAVHAQTNSDNPAAGLDLGLPPAPDITVVEAVYGGRESYVDVTKEVSELLGKPDSFEPTGVALGVKDPVHGQANYLIIVFDLDGHRYVFTRQNNGDKVNARFLKAEAKLEKESGPRTIAPATTPDAHPQTNSDNPTAGLALGPPPDADVTVVEAVYGGLKQYVDVTRQVTELLGKPESFDPTGHFRNRRTQSGEGRLSDYRF